MTLCLHKNFIKTSAEFDDHTNDFVSKWQYLKNIKLTQVLQTLFVNQYA